MQVEVFTIHAFTESVFGGNPAAVCPLDEWVPDELMQKIAAEFVVSETAFFVKSEDGFDIRWFTPTVEIDLCGHATLASAYVLYHHKGFAGKSIEFHSQSGLLSVENEGDTLFLDFPARPAEPCDIPPQLIEGLGSEPEAVMAARDYLVVFPSEETVRNMKPDFNALNTLDKAVIVTAPGNDVDFVSRFFAPVFGIQEDPVTGSSHCTLIPYWSKRLRKKEMEALQVSKRGGMLCCRDEGERVKIGGRAVTYLQGTITI